MIFGGDSKKRGNSAVRPNKVMSENKPRGYDTWEEGGGSRHACAR